MWTSWKKCLNVKPCLLFIATSLGWKWTNPTQPINQLCDASWTLYPDTIARAEIPYILPWEIGNIDCCIYVSGRVFFSGWFCPFPSGLLHWHRGNDMIGPVPSASEVTLNQGFKGSKNIFRWNIYIWLDSSIESALKYLKRTNHALFHYLWFTTFQAITVVNGTIKDICILWKCALTAVS